jgi:hypothetical protein
MRARLSYRRIGESSYAVRGRSWPVFSAYRFFERPRPATDSLLVSRK